MLADMHTHTNRSADSTCDIYDLYLTQIEKGTHIFAVTDHFDNTDTRPGNDFDSIKASVEDVLKLRERCDSKHLILCGVEAGEALKDINSHNKLVKSLPFDVVLGSIHTLKHKDFSYEGYFHFDFSKFSKPELSRFLNAYFDEMIEMVSVADFDILTHLTCPFRYLAVRNGIIINASEYGEKIETILNTIIKRSIALEVNTSCYSATSNFNPSGEIVEIYRNLGGELITLGSDCHTSDRASANFAEAKETLQKIGFDGIYYYQNRKPHKISI